MLPYLPHTAPFDANFRISDLDDILNRLGEDLQLNATRRLLANARYKSVAEWIESDEFFFKTALISVYPQGSFRIRTTVKPYLRSEFDLDFVVHLDFLTGKNYPPMEVLDQLERRLRENDIYRTMIERKNRCIRITYANDFHMDIMVGCQETYYEQNRIIVPDRKTKNWTDSNPIGYGNWFTARGQLSPERDSILLKAYEARNQQIRLSENLPVEPPYELKPPLERAVQIIKRKRDVYFYNKSERATSSIILTTLAAESYQGELSVFDTIDNVLKYIERKSLGFMGRREPFPIPNPANPDENFSEKWFEDRELFDAFLSFVKDTRQTWESLKKATNPSLRDSLLEQAFGESRIKKLIAEQREYRNAVEKSQRLSPYAKAAGFGIMGTTPHVKPSFEPTPIQNQPARRSGGKTLPLRPAGFSHGTNYLQQRWIEQSYPGVFTTSIRNGVMTSIGKIRPTEDCDEYRIRIVYVPGKPPHVFIDSHRIEASHLIHMYNNGALCLHYPPDINWKHRTSLAAYTIPWIAEWVVCYEFWKITGKWEGSEFKH
jgi:hypothetical protein